MTGMNGDGLEAHARLSLRRCIFVMPICRSSRAAVLGSLILLAACGGLRRTPPASSPARGEVAPRNGLEVVGAVRRAHPSRALRSLAFTLTTIGASEDSARETRARAHASLPGRFRLTRLPLSARSGYVRNRQRVSVFESGRRVVSANRVDLALLLAYDLFAQSLDTTIMWLDSARVRFALARRDEFDGRDVWVVGALEGDTTSLQFWVDAEHWRVVRVIQRDPGAPRDIIDIRFAEFAPVLDVPVPMRITTYRNGELSMVQEVSNLAVNPSLPSSTFDLSRWREVRAAD
jgi:hypothetical protein